MRARQWVESYVPTDPPQRQAEFYKLHFSARSVRTATLEKDKDLLYMLAYQCDKQKSPFPKRVLIVDTYIPNASFGNGNTFAFTTDIIKQMKPRQLEAVVGHEVGHSSQRGLRFGYYVALFVMDFLINEGMNALYSGLRNNTHQASQTAANIFRKWYVHLPLAHVVFSFGVSKYRQQMELDADRRGGHTTNAQDMADALKVLQRRSAEIKQARAQGKHKSNIVFKVVKTILHPFPDHPPLSKRIKILEERARRESREHVADSSMAR